MLQDDSSLSSPAIAVTQPYYSLPISHPIFCSALPNSIRGKLPGLSGQGCIQEYYQGTTAILPPSRIQPRIFIAHRTLDQDMRTGQNRSSTTQSRIDNKRPATRLQLWCGSLAVGTSRSSCHMVFEYLTYHPRFPRDPSWSATSVKKEIESSAYNCPLTITSLTTK